MTRIIFALPSDAPALTELAERSKSHWGYSRDLMDLWKAEDAFTITPKMCASKLVRIAKDTNRIVGFYRIEGSPPHAELSDLWVDPDAIGHGYGGLLMTDLKTFAAKKGYQLLEIHSDPHAVGFYEHAGARRIGKTTPHPKTGRVLPILQLEITEQ